MAIAAALLFVATALAYQVEFVRYEIFGVFAYTHEYIHTIVIIIAIQKLVTMAPKPHALLKISSWRAGKFL